MSERQIRAMKPEGCQTGAKGLKTDFENCPMKCWIVHGQKVDIESSCNAALFVGPSFYNALARADILHSP
jgi:hypothetical protein